MTVDDRIAIDDLLQWSLRPLGKARKRQLIIDQFADHTIVTLRFGERYVITISGQCGTGSTCIGGFGGCGWQVKTWSGSLAVAPT